MPVAEAPGMANVGIPMGGVGLLSELAIASYLYSSMTTYNASLEAFRKQTDGRLSLANRQHRYALVRWLNAWGCRLPRASHGSLVSALEALPADVPRATKSWPALPDLGSIDGSAMDHTLFALCEQLRPFGVRLTAASKLLFALHPDTFVPWDTGIRKQLRLDPVPGTYRTYLSVVADDVQQLRRDVGMLGVTLDDIPGLLQRPDATLPQLMSELYLVRWTRGVRLPNRSTISDWLRWMDCADD